MTNATELKTATGETVSQVFVLQTFDENGEPRNYLSEDSAGEIFIYATREQAEDAKKVFDEVMGGVAEEEDREYLPSQVLEMTLTQYSADSIIK